MKNLHIEKSKSTLEVNFDYENGTLEIEGASYPENAIEFFSPIYKWIKDYINEGGKQVILNLKLNYLNTSSSKCLLDLLEILEEYYKNGGDSGIKWYYEKHDEDIMETGEEFAEDLELPFEIIAY